MCVLILNMIVCVLLGKIDVAAAGKCTTAQTNDMQVLRAKLANASNAATFGNQRERS